MKSKTEKKKVITVRAYMNDHAFLRSLIGHDGNRNISDALAFVIEKAKGKLKNK